MRFVFEILSNMKHFYLLLILLLLICKLSFSTPQVRDVRVVAALPEFSAYFVCGKYLKHEYKLPVVFDKSQATNNERQNYEKIEIDTVTKVYYNNFIDSSNFFLLAKVSYIRHDSSNIESSDNIESLEKGFMCFNNDSLSFRLPWGEYFYGSYTMEDSLIILGDNLLADRNFYIEEEPCDSNVLEITCNYLERQWYIGYAGENPDTNIYLRKVDNTLHRLVVFYNNDKNFKHSINGVVSFDSLELQSIGDSLVLFLQVEGSHVLTEASLPNRLGHRYSFFQKHYEMIPFLSKKRICFFDEHRIYFKKETGQIIFDFGNDWQGNYYIEYVFSPIDKNTSCIQELKRYYPDL